MDVVFVGLWRPEGNLDYDEKFIESFNAEVEEYYDCVRSLKSSDDGSVNDSSNELVLKTLEEGARVPQGMMFFNFPIFLMDTLWNTADL